MKQKPQNFNTTMLKNLILCMSDDITRDTLNGLRLRITAPGICQLMATDGHVAIKYENVCLTSVRNVFKSEYGVKLQEIDGQELVDYVLYPEHKRRKKVNKALIEVHDIYPRVDNVIPDRSNCPSNINHYPIYHLDVLTTYKKITGKSVLYPNYWASATGASVVELDDHGSIFLAMPVRPPKEWEHYTAWEAR
jgi:hypothetical protein